MKSTDLVYAIKKRMYDDAFLSYKETYSKSLDGTDEYSKSIKFFQSLREEEKELILFLIKTTIWDTLSDFFGWLDGVYLVSNQEEDVDLKFEDKEQKINGNLQDIWVSIKEGIDKKEIEDTYN